MILSRFQKNVMQTNPIPLKENTEHCNFAKPVVNAELWRDGAPEKKRPL